MRRIPDSDPVTQSVDIKPLPPLKRSVVVSVSEKDLRRALDKEAARLDAEARKKNIPPARRLPRSSTEVQE